MNKSMIFVLPLSGLLLAACGDSTEQRELQIGFVPQIAGQAFACNQQYTGVGNGNSQRYEARDFRWYASDFKLRGADHREASVSLEPSDFQYQGPSHNVALLGAVNGCDSGSAEPEMNLLVNGKAPSGDYQQLCFNLGVPFALNHTDVSASDTPSPLNVPAMNWFWRGGRKFLKIDGIGDPGGAAQAFNFHLGSTGCSNAGGTDGMGDGKTAPPDQPCSQPNTPEICLDLSAIESGTRIRVDPARVAAGTDTTTNTEGTPPGCMGFINDPECADIMPKYGLDYPLNGEIMPAQSHSLFKLEG